jgi:hypothetical protein
MNNCCVSPFLRLIWLIRLHLLENPFHTTDQAGTRSPLEQNCPAAAERFFGWLKQQFFTARFIS